MSEFDLALGVEAGVGVEVYQRLVHNIHHQEHTEAGPPYVQTYFCFKSPSLTLSPVRLEDITELVAPPLPVLLSLHRDDLELVLDVLQLPSTGGQHGVQLATD